MNEVAVQATASDACVSKLSATTKGYIDDPFVCHFVKKPVKRQPLINRGE
jgi:tRNA wybutosine-synthesizing protein 4